MITDTKIHDEIRDLLDEVASKNHVVIVKYAAQQTKNGRSQPVKFEGDQIAQTIAHPPALIQHDILRKLAGKKPIYLEEALRRVGGELVGVTQNLRSTQGIDFVSLQLGGAAATSTAQYLALSNNTGAANASETASTLPWSSNQSSDAAASGTTGEMSYSGMARKIGTYAHTGGVTSYTQAATWTASGTVTAAQKAGNFGGTTANTAQGASTTNQLFLTNVFTSTTLASADQLSLTWTVNI